MANTDDTASDATASAARSSRSGSRRSRASTSTPREEDLEAQIAQLQDDIKSISQTLTRMGENRVDEARSTARLKARELADKGQAALDEAQDEFTAIEKQIKDTIREKPLTAVAGAAALGFLLAVVTR